MIGLLLSHNAFSQIYDCTDALATNYNHQATHNNGSCLFNTATVSSSSNTILSLNLDETSGLLLWNNRFWTHNDDSDINLYSINPNDLTDIQSYILTGTVNKDWEEISHDANYIYLGDFGNNANGNRTDLKILRVEKNSLLAHDPKIDTISFSYPLQTDFTATGGNNTNFDCEAFIITLDSIYLFTKEWKSKKTTIYALPKIAGNYTARYCNAYNVNGLITGATYVEDKRLIVLSGYSSLLQPFIFLLYDYNAHEFFGGNKRMIAINSSFHQVEGITTTDGLTYYITNERLTSPLVIDQKLQTINLTNYLDGYLNPVTTSIKTSITVDVHLFPNPTNSNLNIETDHTWIGSYFSILDVFGRVVLKGEIKNTSTSMNIEKLEDGVYYFTLDNILFNRIIKN
jgi:hypothetical protein